MQSLLYTPRRTSAGEAAVNLAEPYLCFANWRYDQAAGRLILTSEPEQQFRLEPRLHQLLNYFLAHPMQIISKNQLMDDVWPDTEGTDAAVMRAVASLRKILQPGLIDGPCIETLSKRGYRWTLAIEQQLPVESFLPTVALPAELPQAPPMLWPEARMHPEHAIFLQAEVHQKGQQQKTGQRWLYVLASALLLVCLLFGFSLFLLNAGLQARQPVYNNMLNFSALQGQEKAALLSRDGSLIFYQYRAPDQRRWQWVQHHSKNHKKKLSSASFSVMSNAVWLDTKHFVFQAATEGQCQFYRQHIELTQYKPEPVAPCEQVITKGLARDKQRLYWLAQDTQTGQVQLWQQALAELGSNKAPLLLYQFAPQYRRPQHLHLQDGQLYLVVEKDFYSSALLQFDLSLHSVRWLKDFAFSITDVSDWQDNSLLLSSVDALVLFRLSSGKVIRLQTAQNGFYEAQRVGEQLLSSYEEDHNSDLASLSLADSAAVATQLPWLHSSKNELKLAASREQIAFVSERSGSSQIWLYQQRLLRQLTHLQGQRQIQQLLWWQQQLYALIDLQLYQVSLSDGSLQLQDIRRPAQLAACDTKLYWTHWTDKGWQLWQKDDAGETQMLLPDVTGVRCAESGNLVLQQLGSVQLQLWSPQSGQFQLLPVQLDWRQTAPEQWLSRQDGLYWLAQQEGITTLWRLRWHQHAAEQLKLPADTEPVALFGAYEGNTLYYQLLHNRQIDIGWLSQTKKPSQ